MAVVGSAVKGVSYRCEGRNRKKRLQRECGTEVWPRQHEPSDHDRGENKVEGDPARLPISNCASDHFVGRVRRSTELWCVHSAPYLCVTPNEKFERPARLGNELSSLLRRTNLKSSRVAARNIPSHRRGNSALVRSPRSTERAIP